MIEGSGSQSIPQTNGSGSRRPKNMWIRIRIRNTDSDEEIDLTFGEEGSRKSFAGNAEKTRRETYEYKYKMTALHSC
jgi:hypothetical protein